MEAQTSAAEAAQGSKTPRRDVYSIVNERIIEQLKNGTVPWRKPWTEAGVPMNLVSRRPYRGINVMLLAMLGYQRNLFLTFKQIQELGGTVAKGERGHMVVYWNYVERDQAHAERGDGTPIEHLAKKVPMLRYYTVFNIAQCDGLPEKYLASPENNWAPIETCDEIVDQMPNKPKITHKEQRAYYDPLRDFVNMPKYNTFDRPEAYYATLFHELVHSTGHRSRLDRKDLLQMAEFGSEPYSHEELVAEIGTCYLQSYAAITTEFEQSAAYIQSWLKKLENDHRFIFSASTHAQKAVDFILRPDEVNEDAQQKTD
jgi:antirestriction protein ArdC